jgi:hypothetical protein
MKKTAKKASAKKTVKTVAKTTKVTAKKAAPAKKVIAKKKILPKVTKVSVQTIDEVQSKMSAQHLSPTPAQKPAAPVTKIVRFKFLEKSNSTIPTTKQEDIEVRISENLPVLTSCSRAKQIFMSKHPGVTILKVTPL